MKICAIKIFDIAVFFEQNKETNKRNNKTENCSKLNYLMANLMRSTYYELYNIHLCINNNCAQAIESIIYSTVLLSQKVFAFIRIASLIFVDFFCSFCLLSLRSFIYSRTKHSHENVFKYSRFPMLIPIFVPDKTDTVNHTKNILIPKCEAH